ncbi:MAG: hypothetical protein GY815_04160 [Gammaproteobacteria bacterium]|nr:hypothetical protein [Gammaproteobacteria bacterium]
MLQARSGANADPEVESWGLGRELFDGFRARVSSAEQGAMSIFTETPMPAPVLQPVPAHEN